MPKNAASFKKQASRMGVDVELPDVIIAPPALGIGLQLYLDAYFDLETERPLGFGFAKIPWSKIRFYADRNHFSQDQFDELVFLIKELDVVHPANK